MGKPVRYVTIVAVATLALLGCAAPARLMDERARQLGLSREVLAGTDYSHVVYHKAARNTFRNGPSHAHSGGAGDNTLHVFLDGDGTPWITRTRIAADPTPRHPLVIQLMARDDAASLYLGGPAIMGKPARRRVIRACGPATDTDPKWWTA